MSRKLWSREELILTLDLYFKIPYNKIDGRNVDVIKLAQLINRSANSVGLRLMNFVACDPYHLKRGVVGMEGGLSVCKPIWDEFYQNNDALIVESNRIYEMFSKELDSKNNLVKIVPTEEMWQEIIDILEDGNMIEYHGDNPYLLHINSIPFYVFIRNLTRAYSDRSPDVCRIQLHRSNKFRIIKDSNIPLIVLGYCNEHKTVVHWSPDIIKTRLNGKGNVSLYSRFSSQISVGDNKSRELKLDNGETVIIVDIDNIAQIFSNYSRNTFISNIPSEQVDTTNDMIFHERKLYELLKNTLNNLSELNAIQICTSYFEEYNIDYNLIMIRDLIRKLKE